MQSCRGFTLIELSIVLVIIGLIPLALKGVAYRPVGAAALLRRNLLLYGLGGIIAPFIFIKLIDLIVYNLLGA